jgi:hypothetical protein
LTDKLASVAIALAFFVGWLTILYAGADHPSPPGFIVVILMDLVAAFVVYRRVPVYAAWVRACRPKRWLLALLEGALAGLIAAGLVSILPFGISSSNRPPATAILTFFAVIAVVGAFNALLIFFLSAAGPGRW